MKKMLIIFILMFCLCIPYTKVSNVLAEDKFVKIIYTTAYVFSKAEANEENIITEYKYGEEFLVLESDVQGVDYSYYKIKITGIENVNEGFILTSQVMDTSIFTPKRELDTNAKISGDAIVYTLKGDNYVETDIIIKSGTKVRLISGYNSSVKYSKIQYTNEDGDIITAYIKTGNIEVSHISRVLIGVIIIAATSVSIILILFGIKKSKKVGIKRIFKKNKK